MPKTLAVQLYCPDECIGELTRFIGYSDPQATLSPFSPALTLSPIFGPATAFKMSLSVARIAVLAACRARLIMHAVAVASTVGTDCGADARVGSLGPLVLGQLFLWLVCGGM